MEVRLRGQIRIGHSHGHSIGISDWHTLWLPASLPCSCDVITAYWWAIYLCKALGKLGNIVEEIFVTRNVSLNVSLFAYPRKHCCGNKSCFPGSKNQIQKHFMFPKCDFCCGNIVSKCLPTLGNMAKHCRETMFPQQCFLVCPGLKR